MKNVFLKLPLSFLLFFSSSILAQEKTAAITLGEKQTIQSQVLGESRELLIYTPDKVTTKLPLILVFDGGGLFSATVSAVRYMDYYSEAPQMPEAVIIGIQNTDRNRDMPVPQQYGGGKGEDNFLKFVKDELIPWATKKYSLNGHTIAIGHSQGGLFVSYLLAKYPETFPWVVALDAPMNVDPKTIAIKEMISKAVKNNNKIRYASMETVYGWRDEWTKYFSESNSVLSKKIPDETHESMAFKGIYEGLKFLFHDFTPPRKDMNLSELKNYYYQTIDDGYGYEYEIPLSVLLSSASRKIPESRKNEIIELLDYAEPRYGSSASIKELRARASVLTNVTNSVVDSILALSPPKPEQIKKYLGTWTGDFITKEGEAFPDKMEISLQNGKAKFITAFDPHSPEVTREPDVLHVSKDGKLVFAIKNRGGGITINILDLDSKGNLVGQGMWVGFTIPQDASPEMRKQLTFLLNTPTKYRLTKQ